MPSRATCVAHGPRASARIAAVIVAALLVALAPSPAAHAQEVPPPPDVTAAGAVLWDPADDRVLAGKAETTARRPASTTKILTVLLTLERADPGDDITVSQHAVEVAATPGAATLGLSAGQQIELSSVLAGLMLRSGNDGAVAVAEHVAGSEDAFVDLMNERARELGLTDTHFINATGLTDDLAHHASPLDLARLGEVALRNDVFAEWAGAPALDIQSLGYLENRNELLGSYEGATGIKTGYTALAGMCLVASAEREGRRLIAVVLGSDDSFGDAAALLDHGFGAYRRVQPGARGEVVGTYRWAHADVAVTAAQGLGWTVPAQSTPRWHLELQPDVAPPVDAGDRLGEARLVLAGEVVDSTPVVAASAVSGVPDGDPASSAGFAVQDALRAFSRLRPVARPLGGS